MKVLIISVNAIGDTYLSCAAIKPLIDNYRDVSIDFVANKDSQLYLDRFQLNKIFYLKRRSISEIIKTILLLKKEKYDVAYSFFPGRVNSFFLLNSNSKIKLGYVNIIKVNDWYDKPQKLFLKGMKTSVNYKEWHPQMNYLERIRMCLELTGFVVRDFNKPKIPYSTLENENLSSDVVIHFTSSRSNRNIETSELIELVDNLSSRMNLKVTLIGSKKDFVRIEKIKENKNTQFISDPPIEILISVLTNTKIFIGVDSFPIHLADAYDIKTIGIFGNTRPESVFQTMANKFIVKKETVCNISYNDILSVFMLALNSK